MRSRALVAFALLLALPAVAQAQPAAAPAAPGGDPAVAGEAEPAPPASASVTASASVAVAPPPPQAASQYRPPPPLPYAPIPTEPPPRSRGFTFGGFLGGGQMQPDCEGDCEGLGGISIGGQLGGFAAPRLALLLDLWFVIGSKEQTYDTPPYQTSRGYIGVSMQYWLAPRFWIKGGFGSAKLATSLDGDVISRTESVLGLLGAAGFEILHDPRYSIDLSLRLGTEAYPRYDGTDDRLTTFSVDLAVNLFR
jgi:hypothetical protein